MDEHTRVLYQNYMYICTCDVYVYKLSISKATK